MSDRIGSPNAIEQRSVEGVTPKAAYFKAHPSLSNTYVLGVGAKGTEAVAYLHLVSGSEFLDNASANEDRIPYLVTTTKVII